MITSPLLSNVRHRAVITPVSPLRTGLIYIKPRTIYRYWTIYRSIEIIIEIGIVHWIGLQIQRSIQVPSKNIQFDMNYILKNTLLHRAARALSDEPK